MINIFPIAYFSYSLAFPLGNVHPDYVIETFTSILAITLTLSSCAHYAKHTPPLCERHALPKLIFMRMLDTIVKECYKRTHS